MQSRKNVVTPKSTSAIPEAKKLTLEEMASDENTCLSRVLAEVDINSHDFIETLAAIDYSPMYEYMRTALKRKKVFDLFDIDLLATRMYLAGRCDQRGAPSTL